MKTRISAGAFSRILAAGFALVLAALSASPSFGSQNSCIMPTVGTVSGLTLVNDINACNGSLLSLYSGASAPASPTPGMLWYNTTTNYVQEYDGTSWSNLWFVDAVNHQISADIGGGITSRTIASAATTDIGSIPQPFVTITGTVTITSLGSSAKTGSIHVAVFSGITTLTYNATSLIIPGAINKTTAAGDMMIALYLGGGNWRVLDYVPLAGTVVSSIDGNTGIFTTNSANLRSSGNVLDFSAARSTLPTHQVFTSSSGTYTKPANVLYIRVRIIGGGGGGGGGGTSSTSGNTGGNTTFSTLTASGGAGGAGGGAGTNGGGTGGAASGGTIINAAGQRGGDGVLNTGGNVRGGEGGSSAFLGGGGAPSIGTGIAGAANTGGGSAGGSGNSGTPSGGGGGGGGSVETFINSPAATYSYGVGAAGTAGGAGTGGQAGNIGATGIIIVDEYYN